MSLLLPSGPGSENLVRKFLLQLLHEAVEVLGDVEEQPDHVVHELRRSNKRVRGLFRLFRHTMPSVSFRRADRKVRDAAKCFSDARDARVMIEVFEGLVDANDGNAFAAVEAELRKRHLDQLTKLELPLLAAEVGSHFGEVMGMAKSWDWPAMSRAELVKGMLTIYRRGRKEFRLAHDTKDSDHFHQLRRRAKYLSFHADWLREESPQHLAKLAEESAELATLLGDHHDLAVFEELMETLPSEISGAKPLARAALEKREELEVAGLALASKVYSSKPKKLRKLLL